ncbi:response regulator [Mucilaginibacter aquariorum]|uniref:Response regulator n=1 Tax=Mucilaginibacter aquariorum TaxID=2967225 RepID=A0ABT1T3P8_9SPHI|nr:response regulator [Mucilaginibacter aquariorum]MCQ6959187.1 response regulator [Mucilaginibacter aquariorum]
MKTTILLIEDNDDIRENTAELLNLEGYQVMSANCGNQALEMIALTMPDLIICDIKMPGMDGFEVLQSLRSESLTRNIPLIFSSANSEQSDQKIARDLGIENYLVKPYDDKQLFACIKNCLVS